MRIFDHRSIFAAIPSLLDLVDSYCCDDDATVQRCVAAAGAGGAGAGGQLFCCHDPAWRLFAGHLPGEGRLWFVLWLLECEGATACFLCGPRRAGGDNAAGGAAAPWMQLITMQACLLRQTMATTIIFWTTEKLALLGFSNAVHQY